MTSLLSLAAAAQPDSGLSWAQTLLIYVGIPVAIYLTIWFLWSIPRWRHSGSYRPGDPWTAAPEWFAGPPAVEGAAIAAIGGSAPAPAASGSTVIEGGGTSARW